MKSAIKYIDYTKEQFLQECLTIGSVSNGLFGYGDLYSMPMKEMEYLYGMCKKIVREVNKDGEQG